MSDQQALFEGPAKRRAMGSHHATEAETHTWLTPLHILDPLGPFDLDPCACPLPRPWSTAETMWTREDAPLSRQWEGRVWLNPPFGPRDVLVAFLARMASHRRGIALLFCRTETEAFHDWVWTRASGALFLKGRPTFHRQDGSLPSANCGAPVALWSYGEKDAEVLRDCANSKTIPGRFVDLRERQ